MILLKKKFLSIVRVTVQLTVSECQKKKSTVYCRSQWETIRDMVIGFYSLALHSVWGNCVQISRTTSREKVLLQNRAVLWSEICFTKNRYFPVKCVFIMLVFDSFFSPPHFRIKMQGNKACETNMQLQHHHFQNTESISKLNISTFAIISITPFSFYSLVY